MGGVASGTRLAPSLVWSPEPWMRTKPRARAFSCRAPPRRDDDGAAEGTRLRRAQQIDMVRDIARRKRTVSAFFQEDALNQTSGAV